MTFKLSDTAGERKQRVFTRILLEGREKKVEQGGEVGVFIVGALRTKSNILIMN